MQDGIIHNHEMSCNVTNLTNKNTKIFQLDEKVFEVQKEVLFMSVIIGLLLNLQRVHFEN